MPGQGCLAAQASWGQLQSLSAGLAGPALPLGIGLAAAERAGAGADQVETGLQECLKHGLAI